METAELDELRAVEERLQREREEVSSEVHLA